MTRSAGGQPRRAHRRRARRSGARVLRRRRARSISDGHSRRERRSTRAGDSRLLGRAAVGVTTYRAGFDAFWEIDVFGRVRIAGPRGGGHRRELRGDARRRAGERGGGSGAQLLRAARAAAAARGGRAQPRQSARDAAADARCGATPASARSRTWPVPAARVAAIEASIPPIRSAIARARASPRGADRRRGRRARRRSGAARRIRRSRRRWRSAKPDSLLRRRPDVRAAERRLAAATAQRRRRGGRSLSAHHRDRVPRPARRARQPVRRLRLARVGGDAGAELGGVRSRQRARPPARRRRRARAKSSPSSSRSVLRALEETENALVNYREEQQRLVKLAEQARESSARRRHRARALPGRRGRLSRAARRGAHATAGRGRRRAGRGGRLHQRHRGLQSARRHPGFVRSRCSEGSGFLVRRSAQRVGGSRTRRRYRCRRSSFASSFSAFERNSRRHLGCV